MINHNGTRFSIQVNYDQEEIFGRESVTMQQVEVPYQIILDE